MENIISKEKIEKRKEKIFQSIKRLEDLTAEIRKNRDDDVGNGLLKEFISVMEGIDPCFNSLIREDVYKREGGFLNLWTDIEHYISLLKTRAKEVNYIIKNCNGE